MNDGGSMFFGGGFMWLIWIALIIMFIYAIKISFNNSSDNSGSTDESPLEILKKRYARGEIDEQEFERRRKELDGS